MKKDKEGFYIRIPTQYAAVLRKIGEGSLSRGVSLLFKYSPAIIKKLLKQLEV